jgi:hypothetical protein
MQWLAYHPSQRLTVDPPAPAAPRTTLRDLLTQGAPQAPPVRLRDNVLGLFGEGQRIRVEGAAPALEVVARPGSAPVPVAPRETVPVAPPDDRTPLAAAAADARGESAQRW